MSKLVSVIIPTYNRSNVLTRAISSVQGQSYKHFEIIVVDDGSTDDTHEQLLPLIESGKIKYFAYENQGVSAARNAGVENSVGELIAFLDSDDEWLPHKLQEQIDYFSANPHIKIVYGEELWFRKGKRVNQKLIHKKSGGWIFEACVAQCLIAPSSVMLERELFLQMEGFDESFQVCEDYDLWLKISSLLEIGFIENPVIIKHGGHDDQLSAKYPAMDFWRLKSMHWILKTRNLSHSHKLIVIESMKRRGEILMNGYRKYGNASACQKVEEMLNELDNL
ncbi:MAG: glycosyltransferase [Bacteriovorax sp.]|jgi:glycosyltransferase involved in cell wall biosynthesis